MKTHIKKIQYFLPTLILGLPMLAYASTNTFKDIIVLAVGYLNDILALLMGVAVVFFVFYVVQYFMRPTDKRAEGAQYVMWSLIGFFVILSMWGLVNILINTFNFGQTSPGSWSKFFDIFPK